VACTPAQIHRQGIRGLDARDLAYGRELGYVLKLLAVARSTDSGVEARVHPAFVPAEHPLARVDGAYNAVHVIGDLCGPVMFSGLGAGGDATASAVLADVVHVARRMALGDPVPPPRENGPAARLLPMAEVKTRCYFRLRSMTSPASLLRSRGCWPSTGSGSPASSSASRVGRAPRKSCCSPMPRPSRPGRRRGAAGEALLHARGPGPHPRRGPQ